MMETVQVSCVAVVLVRFPDASTMFLAHNERQITTRIIRTTASHGFPTALPSMERQNLSCFSSEQYYSLVRLDHPLSLLSPSSSRTVNRPA